MDVVVVESPTKAKTIGKYLGPGYTVLASYGHVRDLPEKEGSVQPDDDFHMIYEVMAEKKKRVDEIVKALKGAHRLWLATDPDREGEAISWHLKNALEGRKALKDIPVGRVVFHEVTKPAVLEAMQHPRHLDDHLIDAYQARRALDYLVGFELSPVLWRKLPGSRSAGRVQSVALRLICEREAEIEAFNAREYWTIEALLRSPKGAAFTARLTHLKGRKLDKLAIGDERAARRAVEQIRGVELAVDAIEKKQVSRNPAPPFSTSTLQQEAARKLGYSADRTMKVAQQLFEGVDLGGETVGLITYMRTDSVALSGEALAGSRRLIGQRYGERYLPEKPRVFKTRTKNAQEAHEAIRPTDFFRMPQEMARHLGDEQRRLYELIWQRTVASQMATALLDRVTVDIGDPDGAVSLRATGQTVAFDGFLKLYQEGRDDPAAEEEDAESRTLPPLQVKDRLAQEKVTPTQHFTEPPPRFSEASLVKRMEELGIGRPSTYASVISVLQNREYVRLDQKRFVPEDKGRLVNAFLVRFFDRWVQPGFTADLEDRLDGVASGERFWKEVLREFWQPFKAQLDQVGERRRAEVIDALDEALSRTLFPPREDGSDPRVCPVCGEGALGLRLSKFGPFIGCSRYPDCRYTRPFGAGGNGEDGAEPVKDRLLGVDPGTAEEVWLKNGRFGPYIHRGSGTDVKRSSIPPNIRPDELDLETALKLLALPRQLGLDPETHEPILAGIGRYGPYLQLVKRYLTLQPEEDVLSIGINRAVELLAQAPARGKRPAAEPLRDLGVHPDDQEPILVLAGRFGPYVKHGKINATLPKALKPETITTEQALELIAGKAAKGGKPVAKKAPAKAAATPVAKAAKPAAKAATKSARAPAKAKPRRTSSAS
jgi:DNA topoisomerase-1